MDSKYDVIVFGGGTAGAIAAVQAGRAGARTLLVEKNAMLGGTMTVGGINAPAHFFAWGEQIIGGIGWELVRRTLEETGQPVPTPEFTRDNSKPKHLSMDKAIFAALCDQAVLDAGVDLLFHAMPAGVAFEDDIWTVTVCTKSGLERTCAKTLIDATGDANVVSLAGFELVRPEVVQPATLHIHCSGYNVQELDFDALRAASEKAIAAGELRTTDISWNDNGPEGFLERRGHNANHLRAAGAETSAGKSAAEVEARQAVLRMYRFFRKQPGLENFRVDWICSEAGIRETATIKGKSTVTVADYESGKVHDDAVCYAFYPIDEHLNDGKGINWRALNQNVLPTIPRGALLPADSRFLLVAGRCLASDREANSALRVECPCMAMGQAAGAMAALSAQTGVDPEELPLDDIYSLLRKHGAVVPGDVTVSTELSDAGNPLKADTR
ncbi:MAG: FAD-dependent oxidoreductase [Planctomycetes bacterium]|nr:FAD-dependent oxidoreductase [Planctomycetota bacterium]